MKLFDKIRKKYNIIKKKNWDDISIAQFNALSLLGKEPKIEDVIKIIYDVDLKNIPIKDIVKYDTTFISKPIPRRPIKKYYILNGTKYNANFELPSISTAQFFDFRNYAEKNDYIGVLSCCLIPDGKEYNDGYDIEQTKADIATMPITEAQTISFFFLNQTAVLLEVILQSSTSQLKKNPKMKENKELMNLLNLLEKMDWLNLTSCL